MGMIRNYANTGWDILQRNEDFWVRFSAPADPRQLLRFSVCLGLMPFSGYLLYYTTIGKIWSLWPWIQTTMPFLRGLMCALLQWVFFATFPILSSFVLETLFYRHYARNTRSCAVVVTYSMTPLFLTALFVGVREVNRALPVLALSAFLYLLFYGFRGYMRLGILRSALFTLVTFALFASIRQVFIFVIGY